MFDIDSRASKLEKEQQKRREQAQKQKVAEEKKRLEYQKREQELAERARIKKEEDEAEQLRKEQLAAEEYQLTNGIMFEKRFTQYYSLVDERDDDKIVLPEDYLIELNQLDVFGRGAITFRLICSVESSQQPTITHAGIREFTAPPNHIGLPRKIVDTIGGDISKLQGIFLKYVVLPKCKFIKVQPKLNRFFEVQPIKRCFEDNLHKHTCLSEGDLLTIQYRGESYPMQIKEIRPEKFVSLLDTDVEVELENSEEFLQKEAEQQRQQQAAVSGIIRKEEKEKAVPTNVFANSTGRVLGANTNSSSSNGSMMTSLATQQPVSNERVALLMQTALLPEPSAATTTAPVVMVKFKLPTGKAVVRTFSTDMPLIQLFVYLRDTLSLDVQQMNSLQIASRVPNKIWSSGDSSVLGMTLQEQDIPAGSLMLIVTY